MSLRVGLLGPPSLVRDGEPIRLGGRKTWGLLALLALEDRPPTRREAIARLVPEANDPLAALRWLLHQVRRALQPEATIDEDQGRLLLRLDDAEVDALRLLAAPGDVDEVERVAGPELLEGMAFDDAPAFELWLAMQRARVVNAAAESLRWAATRIASEEPERAMRLLERGLALDPFCEGKNELLVELYVQAGNRAAARAHLDAVERLFERELGVRPPETIRRPLDRPRPPAPTPPQPSARALLQAARARFDAGEYDRAVETARRSADVALATGEPELELESLVLLGSVLVHTHRGRDSEAKGLLARAAQLATDIGDLATLADVERELGFVACMEANYGAAESSFARSATLARSLGDEDRAGRAETYLGVCRSDRCDFSAAEEVLRSAIGRFEATSNPGWQGYAEGMLGRVHARSGMPDRGREIALAGAEHCRAAGWMAILPWPILVAADCALSAGDAEAARDGFAEALTLGREIRDPCWEGLALRGLAHLRRMEGDRPGAIDLLEEGLACCTRFDDVYAWARAVILTDLVELEEGRHRPHLEEAFELAVAGPMPDLARRLWRWRDALDPQTRSQTADP